MISDTIFRRSLLWKLVLSSLLYAGAVSLTIRFQHDLGAPRLLLPLVIGIGLYLLKLLLDAGWLDATALPRERQICRSIVYLMLLCSALSLAIKLYHAISFYLP